MAGKRLLRIGAGLRRTRAALAHFAPFLRPRRGGLLLALAVLLLETAASLAQPWPLALILDYVLAEKPAPLGMDRGFLLAGIALLLVFVATAARALAAVRRYLLQKLGQQTIFDMREALYRKVHDLGLDYHGKKRTGDTITRVTSDVKEVRSLLVDSVVEVLSSVLILLGMLVIMLVLNWRLTLLALLTIPFLFFAVKFYRQALIERMRVVRTKEGIIASVAQESITGIRAVKIFGREREEMGRFREESRGSLEASVESSLIEAKFSIILGLVGGLGTALVVYFGARQAMAGTISVGDLTVFVAYMGLFLSPLWSLSRQANQIGKSLVSGERIIELLSAMPAVRDAPGAVPVPRVKGHVTFDDVYFAYEGAAGEVLRGASFDVAPGARAALVGVSGAGKTTITSLIARLYDPRSGRVMLDGEDVRRYTQKSVRDAIAFVPQEAMLFRASVADNIAYGYPDATREEIERAAQLAGADGFIRELPEGYDTVLAERGESLSGGQRQRVSIARAMLRDAPILVLDEPEAGLDAGAAAVVQESWHALTQGRTAFVIAHDLRLVRDVDEILVIDEGRIAESGTHEELLERDGLYARLYFLQEGEQRHTVQP